MNLLRKISYALSDKDPSMHFEVGQVVWRGHKIIDIHVEGDRVLIMIERDGDTYPWKDIPTSKAMWEYNLEFD